MNFWERARVVHRAWRYRWRTERGCVRFLLNHLQPGQSALDIGAHKGVFSYWMERRVGRTGRVIAFEPQPDLADYLQRIKDAFGFDNLQIVRAALSSTPGTRQLLLPVHHPRGRATLESTGEDGTHIAVPTTTLDQYLDQADARPVHFIKCDVEGHEFEVFRGGERMLREDRPLLMFECQDFRDPLGHVRKVAEYLQDLGYEGYFFDGAEMIPFKQFRVSEHQREGVRYLDNFAFLPRRVG